MTKFCTDCKHYHPSGILRNLDQCFHNTKNIDLITGKILPTYAYRERARTSTYECGHEAKFFTEIEKRPTLWQHVKQLMKIN